MISVAQTIATVAPPNVAPTPSMFQLTIDTNADAAETGLYAHRSHSDRHPNSLCMVTSFFLLEKN